MSNKGFVYFIQCEDLIKIGYSQNINKRIKQLSTGNGKTLKLVYKIQADRYLETVLHKKYQNYHVSGEWFEAEPILRILDQKKKELEVQRELGLIK